MGTKEEEKEEKLKSMRVLFQKIYSEKGEIERSILIENISDDDFTYEFLIKQEDSSNSIIKNTVRELLLTYFTDKLSLMQLMTFKVSDSNVNIAILIKNLESKETVQSRLDSQDERIEFFCENYKSIIQLHIDSNKDLSDENFKNLKICTFKDGVTTDEFDYLKSINTDEFKNIKKFVSLFLLNNPCYKLEKKEIIEFYNNDDYEVRDCAGQKLDEIEFSEEDYELLWSFVTNEWDDKYDRIREFIYTTLVDKCYSKFININFLVKTCNEYDLSYETRNNIKDTILDFHIDDLRFDSLYSDFKNVKRVETAEMIRDILLEKFPEKFK